MLTFEQPIFDLQARIRDMQQYATEQDIDLSTEIQLLEQRLARLQEETFSNLTRWQRVQVARAPGRPTALDYLTGTFDNFFELHGDRTLGDDPAIVTGFAELAGQDVIVIAQQKGRDTKENIHRNFGMAHPSGYRKAMRMFDLADRFKLPVITLIDTPGAYPGLAAEEQGQAWVIAESIRRMSQLTVPAIALVIGEGGSGGALAIGVGNRVLIMENAIYSVISPESCAAILWRDAAEAEQAAEALRLTATDLLELRVVDRVVKEPLGGAHNQPAETMNIVRNALVEELASLAPLSTSELLTQRYERFRALGEFAEGETEAENNEAED